MRRQKEQKIREKQHRLPRAYYRGEVLAAITARVADQQSAFARTDIVKAFVQLLQTAVATHSCTVPVYCFMPDHLHLMLQGSSAEADLWRAMVLFKQRTGFWFAQNATRYRWQKDFYDHIVRSEEDWRAQIRYIANNPVRANLVKQWDAYPYTGAIGFDLNAVLTSTM